MNETASSSEAERRDLEKLRSEPAVPTDGDHPHSRRDLEKLRSEPAVPTDGDHPHSRPHWEELKKLQGSRANGAIHLHALWRGNLVRDHAGEYRKEDQYVIPFPFELRRDPTHGELWIRADEARSRRPGLDEAWHKSGVLYGEALWVLLYSLNLGLGRDQELREKTNSS